MKVLTNSSLPPANSKHGGRGDIRNNANTNNNVSTSSVTSNAKVRMNKSQESGAGSNVSTPYSVSNAVKIPNAPTLNKSRDGGMSNIETPPPPMSSDAAKNLIASQSINANAGASTNGTEAVKQSDSKESMSPDALNQMMNDSSAAKNSVCPDALNQITSGSGEFGIHIAPSGNMISNLVNILYSEEKTNASIINNQVSIAAEQNKNASADISSAQAETNQLSANFSAETDAANAQLKDSLHELTRNSWIAYGAGSLATGLISGFGAGAQMRGIMNENNNPVAKMHMAVNEREKDLADMNDNLTDRINQLNLEDNKHTVEIQKLDDELTKPDFDVGKKSDYDNKIASYKQAQQKLQAERDGLVNKQKLITDYIGKYNAGVPEISEERVHSLQNVLTSLQGDKNIKCLYSDKNVAELGEVHKTLQANGDIYKPNNICSESAAAHYRTLDSKNQTLYGQMGLANSLTQSGTQLASSAEQTQESVINSQNSQQNTQTGNDLSDNSNYYSAEQAAVNQELSFSSSSNSDVNSATSTIGQSTQGLVSAEDAMYQVLGAAS